MNSFSAKLCLIFHTRKAPIPSGVATTRVRELGIRVSVWVGRTVAASCCVASGLGHADLVSSLTQAYF